MTEPFPAETISVPEFRLNSTLVRNKKNLISEFSMEKLK